MVLVCILYNSGSYCKAVPQLTLNTARTHTNGELSAKSLSRLYIRHREHRCNGSCVACVAHHQHHAIHRDEKPFYQLQLTSSATVTVLHNSASHCTPKNSSITSPQSFEIPSYLYVNLEEILFSCRLPPYIIISTPHSPHPPHSTHPPPAASLFRGLASAAYESASLKTSVETMDGNGWCGWRRFANRNPFAIHPLVLISDVHLLGTTVERWWRFDTWEGGASGQLS